MYKVLIIDDLPEVSDVLLFLLESNFSHLFETINVSNSFAEAVTELEKNNYDLVFLDIELDHNKTGFQVLDTIKRTIDFSVIITTSHSHYALDAIKYSAIDFLLKPVDLDELKISVERFKANQNSKNDFSIQFQNLKEQLDLSLKLDKKIILKTRDSIQLVKIGDIIRCEAEINYTNFYLLDRKIVVSKSLKEYSEMLQEVGFFRAHKSHLINLDYFQSYEKKDGMIQMSDGSKVPLSIRKKESFLEVLNSFG
jgi:two-component system LytT family response regulator